MNHARQRVLRSTVGISSISLLIGCIVENGVDDDAIGAAASAITSQTEAEPNNEPNNIGVKALTLGGDHRGAFAAGDPADYWRLDVPYRTYLNFFLGQIPAGSDYNVKLYRSTDLVTPVWSGTNPGNADEIVMRRDTAAGTYFLNVYAASNPRSNLSYLLRAAATATSRGWQWVNAQVPYCGGPNGGSDLLCGGTCVRTGAAASPLWDAYRSDCSGFVSWAWGLPAPGRTTQTLPNVAATIPASTLTPGDILLGPGHVVLFDAWNDKATGKATILHEPSCGGVASAVDVTLTGVSSAASVKLWGSTYTAYRYAMP